MASRKIEFSVGEYYHIYNRGVDKRDIFADKNDLNRFFLSLKLLNTPRPIGSIYQQSFIKNPTPNIKKKQPQLVKFVCYALNPNHFHLLIKPLVNKGVEKFMHRLGTGFTLYFNNQHERSGVLFEGKFKAKHINTNEYLLHLSSYINFNNQIHPLRGRASKLSKTSWDEYQNSVKDDFCLCDKKVILEQFGKPKDYENFAREALEIIRENKELQRDLEDGRLDTFGPAYDLEEEPLSD